MKNTRELTLNAFFIAITVLFAVVPNLGILQIGAVSITILHVPVIIAGLVLGMKSALINSFAFGVSTLFVALTRSTGILDPLFINPLVSVLPRLGFGLMVGLTYNLSKKFIKNFTGQAIVVSVVSTFFHSVFVLSALFIATLGRAEFAVISTSTKGLFLFFFGVFVSNALLEIGAAVLIAVPVAGALKRLNRGKL